MLRWFYVVGASIRSLFARRTFDEQLRADVKFHLEQATTEYLHAGLSPDEAHRAALKAFGDPIHVMEDVREMSVWMWWEQLAQDLRYALRGLRRSPAFAVTAVLSLALGIGVNTAIFSIVDTVEFRVLPVQQPHELVFLRASGPAGLGGAPPYPCFERFRNETTAFAGMAAFASDELRVEVDGIVEQVFGQVASGSYFDLLGLKPIAGRLMMPADEQLDPPVAVIGYGYAQRRFGRPEHAVGRTLSSGGRTYTIVGVTSADFWGLQPGRQVDVTVPITQARGMLADAGAWWFDVVARLGPDATVQRATAETDAIFKSFMKDGAYSDELRGRRFDHMQLTSASLGLAGLRSRFSRPLYALTFVGAIVLLVGCANLAHLLLARGAARGREFAIRLATGASARRLLQQLLTETLLIFALGSSVGLLVAHAAIQGLTSFFTVGRNPILLNVQYDWRLAAFVSGVALAAGLFTGLWPAVRAMRTDPHKAMKDGDARLAGRRLGEGRVLVTTQVALSLVLLVTAVIFVKTIVNLRTVDLGFTASRVLTMSLNPDFPGENARGARAEFWRRALDRVQHLPGVRFASLSVLTPLSGRDTGRAVNVRGYTPLSDADKTIRLNHVSQEYFRTFGIRVIEGRTFTLGDVEGAAKVAIVNETAAKAYFGGRSALGEILRFTGAGAYQIVGVVQDHKHKSVREETPRFAYVPLWQPVDANVRITLAVVSDQLPSVLAAVVGHEVRAVNPSTLVSDVISVEEQIDATLISERLLSQLATAFAALALLLAAIGLYGVVSYSVVQRRAEFGVRIALGAAPSSVALRVVWYALGNVVAGVCIGLPVAVATARMAEGLLFGVTAIDSHHYLLSAILLAIVACVAAWLPARRIVAIDPSEALRCG